MNNDGNDVALEMALIFEEEQRKFLEAEAERARKYKVASIFLAQKMMDDLNRVKANLETSKPDGSYTSKQKVVSKKSIIGQIDNTSKLIEFIKNADQEYILESDGIHSVIRQVANYFENDSEQLHLAKLSYELRDAHMYASYSGMFPEERQIEVTDAVVKSLEKSFPKVFKE